MGFDKAKVMRAAEKYLAQGKIPAAIKEYQQVVASDPDDFTVINLLGDLYVRTDAKNDAISCFSQVAEHYRAEGFALKAIAMYKKMERLNPGSVEVASKLAPLYQMQGLVVDARANYLIVADAYQRSGQTQRALEVLRKIADLDPNNTDIRLKLGEGYLRENFRAEAAEAFSEAGARLQSRAQYERAIDAYAKALSVQHNDRPALSGMASTYISMGTPDDAADLLERAVAEQPDDVELLSILAHAYVEIGNITQAERATAELVAREPGSYRRYIEVAQMYLKVGDLDATMRVVGSITEQMLSGDEEQELTTLVTGVLARNPEHLDALRLLVRIYTWQRDDERLRTALERLAEAAQLGGGVEEERHAYAQLVRLCPDDAHYRERFQELGGSEDDIASLGPRPRGANDDSVPTYENLTTGDGMVSSADMAQFEWAPAESATQSSDPSSSFADLNDGWKPPTPAPAPAYEFEISNSPADRSKSSGVNSGRLREELEGVDFYISQGYMDIASSTLDMLEQQFGTNVDIDRRRMQIAGGPVAPVAPVASAKVPAVKEPESLEFDLGLDPGLASIFDEFKSAIEEEEAPPASGDYETHYNLGIAYKEMELLDDAIEEFQQACAQIRPGDGTARYLQSCNLLGHCFLSKGIPKLAVMWFQRGLSAKGHSEDEYQALRYDLGNAFRMMGDLDKAIDMFTEVYGVNVSYRGVAEKLRDLQDMKASKM